MAGFQRYSSAVALVLVLVLFGILGLQELRLLPGHVIKNLHGEPEEEDLKADQLVANRRRCLLHSRKINTTGGSVRRRRDASSSRNGHGRVRRQHRRLK